MFRNYKNYKIYLRKDGRYAARVMDQGHSTVFYGRTKKEVQQKLEVFIAELNATAQIKYEMAHPTKYMTLRNWAYLCLNTYCVANIQGNTYAASMRIVPYPRKRSYGSLTLCITLTIWLRFASFYACSQDLGRVSYSV